MVISLKTYIALFAVQVCAAFSVAIVSVALIASVHNNHGSVSILMLSMTVPAILFSRIIGGLFDKYEKKKCFISVIVFQLLLIAGMLHGGLFASNRFIYLFAFFTFSVHIFIDLLLQTSVAYITKETQYLKFNSALSLTENLGVVIGPILGGYFVYRNALPTGLMVIFSLYTLIFISTFFLTIPKTAGCEPTTPKTKSPLEKTKNHRLKLIFYAVALFGFGIAIINVMQISFVVSRYDTNELGFGLTESAWGAGMAAGAFITLLLHKRVRYNAIFGCSYILIGLAISALLISSSFYVALFLFLLIGVGNSMVSIVSTTLIQQSASPAELGKSLGIKTMVFQVSSLSAMAITGFLEWVISPVWLFFAAGVIFLLGGKLVLYLCSYFALCSVTSAQIK